jgi:hypothetical protein
MPRAKDTPYLAPYFIPTSAHQTIEEWSIKESMYYEPTGRKLEDYGYGLHYSTSATTLGCVRFGNKADLLLVVNKIVEAFENKEQIIIVAE